MKKTTKKFQKCKKCGSTQFILTESLCYKANMINGVLEVNKNFDNEIDSIICEKCGQDIIKEDFEITFNW